MMKQVLKVGLIALAPKLIEEAYEYSCTLLFGEDEPEPTNKRKKPDKTKLNLATRYAIRSDYDEWMSFGRIQDTDIPTKKLLVVYLNKTYDLNKTQSQYNRIFKS